MKKQKYNIKIKDLSFSERPREKLIKSGPDNLKNYELLAIVLTTGSRNEEVMTMASRLIKDYGEKSLIKEKNAKSLSTNFNLPINKACQLIACLEIGKRFFKRDTYEKISFRCAKDVFAYLKNMSELKKEQLRGLYLNSQFQLIYEEIISIGTLDKNLLHPREIFKPAIFHSASAVIIAHNHPSGNVKASQDDLKITKKLIEVSKLLNIDLLDHIIIGDNQYNSLIKS